VIILIKLYVLKVKSDYPARTKDSYNNVCYHHPQRKVVPNNEHLYLHLQLNIFM